MPASMSWALFQNAHGRNTTSETVAESRCVYFGERRPDPRAQLGEHALPWKPGQPRAKVRRPCLTQLCRVAGKAKGGERGLRFGEVVTSVRFSMCKVSVLFSFHLILRAPQSPKILPVTVIPEVAFSD